MNAASSRYIAIIALSVVGAVLARISLELASWSHYVPAAFAEGLAVGCVNRAILMSSYRNVVAWLCFLYVAGVLILEIACGVAFLMH